MNMIFGKRNDSERLLTDFSLKEVALIGAVYRSLFKDQINNPTADNNHIINYNLKISNYLMINSTIHTLSAGAATYLCKVIIGNRIENITTNYLGMRRGWYLAIVGYVGIYCVIWSQFNNAKRLNINHLINAREQNGEIMMNIILKHYPHKVNIQRYRQILTQKYESQLLRVNIMDQYSQQQPVQQQQQQAPGGYYKFTHQNAIANYVQDQVPVPSQNQGLTLNGIPMQAPVVVQGSAIDPSIPAIVQPQPQQRVPPQSANHGHQQEQHLQQLMKLSQQKESVQGQEKVVQTEGSQQNSQQQPERQKIVDQMREQQNISPYLSTNPVFAQPQGAQKQSPYFIAQQQNNESHYMDQIGASGQTFGNSERTIGQNYKYQGHYYNIAQQARRDSS